MHTNKRKIVQLEDLPTPPPAKRHCKRRNVSKRRNIPPISTYESKSSPNTESSDPILHEAQFANDGKLTWKGHSLSVDEHLTYQRIETSTMNIVEYTQSDDSDNEMDLRYHGDYFGYAVKFESERLIRAIRSHMQPFDIFPINRVKVKKVGALEPLMFEKLFECGDASPLYSSHSKGCEITDQYKYNRNKSLTGRKNIIFSDRDGFPSWGYKGWSVIEWKWFNNAVGGYMYKRLTLKRMHIQYDYYFNSLEMYIDYATEFKCPVRGIHEYKYN